MHVFLEPRGARAIWNKGNSVTVGKKFLKPRPQGITTSIGRIHPDKAFPISVECIRAQPPRSRNVARAIIRSRDIQIKFRAERVEDICGRIPFIGRANCFPTAHPLPHLLCEGFCVEHIGEDGDVGFADGAEKFGVISVLQSFREKCVSHLVEDQKLFVFRFPPTDFTDRVNLTLRDVMATLGKFPNGRINGDDLLSYVEHALSLLFVGLGGGENVRAQPVRRYAAVRAHGLAMNCRDLFAGTPIGNRLQGQARQVSGRFRTPETINDAVNVDGFFAHGDTT